MTCKVQAENWSTRHFPSDLTVHVGCWITFYRSMKHETHWEITGERIFEAASALQLYSEALAKFLFRS